MFSKTIINIFIFIIILSLISIVIYQSYPRINLRPHPPTSILKECKKGDYVVPAKEKDKTIQITLEIVEKRGSLCKTLYKTKGPLSLMDAKTYIFNEKGNLCFYGEFSGGVRITDFICNFLSLYTITPYR